jgi:hypothetical protein
MKCIKKTCSLILALLLAVSVLVLPAAALDNTWVTRFQTMPLIYSATATKPGNDVYVKAIQRYLFSNSSTRSTMGSTTVDGIWGTRTESAVKVFQRAMSLSLVDGKVGSGTWGRMAETLSYFSTVYNSCNCKVLYLLDGNTKWYVYLVKTGNNSYDYYYYHSNSSNNAFSEDNFFHCDNQ